jgi:hypothetical protein
MKTAGFDVKRTLTGFRRMGGFERLLSCKRSRRVLGGVTTVWHRMAQSSEQKFCEI